ncbi:MAG: hypothetical protein R3308_10800, partial [Thiohalobacterales bacterium]|nr:hypothetical protein [Thiohalobacterales bacterium]
MNAEDYFLIDPASMPAGRSTAGRSNRNLSAVISTIRDDGPSDLDEPVSGEAVVQAAGGETDKGVHAGRAAPRQRIRALPGRAVLLKVAGI